MVWIEQTEENVLYLKHFNYCFEYSLRTTLIVQAGEMHELKNHATVNIQQLELQTEIL